MIRIIYARFFDGQWFMASRGSIRWHDHRRFVALIGPFNRMLGDISLKVIILRLKSRQLEIVHAELSRINSIKQLLEIAERDNGTIAGYYIARVLVFLNAVLVPMK